jgi:hypothetical protein
MNTAARLSRSSIPAMSLAVLVFVAGCAAMQAKALLDASAVTDHLTVQEAYTKVNGVLVDTGFDIKHGDPAAGLVTTEYKPIGTSTSWDAKNPWEEKLGLQIRVTITDQGGGKLQVKLAPVVRVVNSRDATVKDRPLKYWDQKGINLVANSKDDGPWVKGELLFGQVTKGISEACGLQPEQMQVNVVPMR